MPKAAAFLAKQLRDLPLEDKAMLINVNYPSIDRPKGFNYLAVPNFHHWSGYTQTASGEWQANYALAGDALSSKQHPTRIGLPCKRLITVSPACILRCGRAESFCASSAGGARGIARRVVRRSLCIRRFLDLARSRALSLSTCAKQLDPIPIEYRNEWRLEGSLRGFLDWRVSGKV